MEHTFAGKWITDEEFYALKPRNVFHKQLDKQDLPCDEHRNRHILFRKKFCCDGLGENAKVYISADDYYKLYINGRFVAQGPAPSYHFKYNYNVVEVGEYLREGENLIAVHTLYQGLINRVWSNAAEVGFERLDFDDSGWKNARINQYDDHILAEQKSKMLVFERVQPVEIKQEAGRILYDFGSNYVGYLCVTAEGKHGNRVTVRCGQELNGDGSLRYDLRAYCRYDEEWVLSDGVSTLDQFDYKSFRYAELLIPAGVTVQEVYFAVRHYPFTLKMQLKPQFDYQELQKIWSLCVHTQQYGVQEVIQDCMDREKGFYLGDGCYTALTNMILTGDDSMVRKLIDDAFSTTFITETLVTCICCSFMQEIAEYPLILVYLVLWHYNFTGDKEYLKKNFKKVTDLLDAYRREYGRDGLLRDVDKWCVVEWPKNFQHGYDVDVQEGKVCEEPHVSLNAYYVAAVRTANRIASILNTGQYRDESPLLSAFYSAFYDEQKALFRDGESTGHISLVGNSFVYGLGLCTEQKFQQNFLAMLEQHKIRSLSLFCTFLVLMGLTQNGLEELVERCLLDEGAWKRILREDGTTTFEGWGKETKKNASLFHLTMSYAALFMADIDLRKVF